MGFSTPLRPGNNMEPTDETTQTTKPPADFELVANLVPKLRVSSAGSITTAQQQLQIINLLLSELHELGQGDWCAGISKDHELDEESTGAQDVGRTSNRFSSQQLPTNESRIPPVQDKSSRLPLVWDGTPEELIPLRLSRNEYQGKKYHALVLTEELVEYWNEVFNADTQLRRITDEKYQEYDMMEDTLADREVFLEKLKAGRPFHREKAQQNDEWYEASRKMYIRLQDLTDSTKMYRDSNLRKIVRRVRDTFKKSLLREKGDTKWFYDLAAMLKKKYPENKPPRRFNYNMDIDEDASSVDTTDEDWAMEARGNEEGGEEGPEAGGGEEGEVQPSSIPESIASPGRLLKFPVIKGTVTETPKRAPATPNTPATGDTTLIGD